MLTIILLLLLVLLGLANLSATMHAHLSRRQMHAKVDELHASTLDVVASTEYLAKRTHYGPAGPVK